MSNTQESKAGMTRPEQYLIDELIDECSSAVQEYLENVDIEEMIGED